MSDGKNMGKLNLVGALSIAALIFSSYVGPGFAAGTQTVAYYLKAGSGGVIWGPLLVGIMTFFWCWLTFEFNRIYKPKDYREQSDMIYKNPVVRNVLGLFKDFFSLVQNFRCGYHHGPDIRPAESCWHTALWCIHDCSDTERCRPGHEGR